MYRLRVDECMIYNKIKDKIISILGLNILKQEALVRLALKEIGISYKKLNIVINHVDGVNVINGVSFPIIYPKSFFFEAKKMMTNEKIYQFYFNGNMSENGGRRQMLEKFEKYNSKIIDSDYGRSVFNKNKFNFDYYNDLSHSEFGLCPHQKDFIGNKDTMWTYRFIECCMTGAIPVVFIETPLGKEFIDGFNYYTDEFFWGNTIEYSSKKAMENYDLAFDRHTFNKLTIDWLKNELP